MSSCGARLATRGGLCHNQSVIRERWYSTGLSIALLAVSVSILFVRWNTMQKRVPLAPLPAVVETATAADSANPGLEPALPRKQAPAKPETIDLNSATLHQLDSLPGIGPVLAGRIIAARDERGRFSAVDDLLNIEGIGQCKLDGIRNYVHVSADGPD